MHGGGSRMFQEWKSYGISKEALHSLFGVTTKKRGIENSVKDVPGEKGGNLSKKVSKGVGGSGHLPLDELWKGGGRELRAIKGWETFGWKVGGKAERDQGN